jgi:hypothetical protein
MRIILLLISLLFIYGCNYNLLKTGDFYATWERLPIVINDDGSWPKLHEAVNQWNSYYMEYTGDTLFTLSSTKGVLIVKAYLAQNEQGRTHCLYRNFFIYECVIRIDERKRFDEESLLIHELGHVIGLNHHEHTIMSPYLGENEVRIDIAENLLDLIKSVYSESIFHYKKEIK